MDDVSSLELKTWRHASLTGWARRDGMTSCLHGRGSRGAEDCPAHATTLGQRFVGGVHYSVHIHGDQVAQAGFYRRGTNFKSSHGSYAIQDRRKWRRELADVTIQIVGGGHEEKPPKSTRESLSCYQLE